VTAAQLGGAIVGLVLILIVFYDLFQSVILPRPAVNKVQLARNIVRPMWLIWRWVSRRTSSIDRSESRLAAFAPVALLMLFAVWAVVLVLGYGLIIDGRRSVPSVAAGPGDFHLHLGHHARPAQLRGLRA
jgi:hypothetical protein